MIGKRETCPLQRPGSGMHPQGGSFPNPSRQKGTFLPSRSRKPEKQAENVKPFPLSDCLPEMRAVFREASDRKTPPKLQSSQSPGTVRFSGAVSLRAPDGVFHLPGAPFTGSGREVPAAASANVCPASRPAVEPTCRGSRAGVRPDPAPELRIEFASAPLPPPAGTRSVLPSTGLSPVRPRSRYLF